MPVILDGDILRTINFMANPHLKRKQLSLSQYEENRAKHKRPKLLDNYPKPVLLLLTVPITILIALLLGYFFYVRSISAQ